MKNIKYLSIKIIYLVFKIKKLNDFKFTNNSIDQSNLSEISFVYKLNYSFRVYIKDDELGFYACYNDTYITNGITHSEMNALKNKDFKNNKIENINNKISLFLKRFVLLLK